MLLLLSCGGVESDSVIERSTVNLPSGRTLYLKAQDGIPIAFDPSASDPNTLVQVSRILDLNQYNVLIEPNLTSDKQIVNTVITGIGISAQDTAGAAVSIRLGIIAREYDPSTGGFSPTTRVFSAQGEDLSNTQQFLTSNSATLLSGLGVRLRRGKVTHLQIQRKPFNSIGQSGSAIGGSKQVILPNNWVAVGFKIRFVSNTPGGEAPFLQDTLLYTGQLTYQ
ncbi:MAG: hypothetical protein J0L93_10165 [Deltaproteobacteria bacterium]|nr:hypothetical protein [Deltaproteobacteria bacterium]